MLLNVAPVSVGVGSDRLPRALELVGVRPNPARGVVRMTLRLPRSGPAEVEILDLAGRRVALLPTGDILPAGERTLAWDRRTGSGVVARSGLYFVRVRAAGSECVGKIILLD